MKKIITCKLTGDVGKPAKAHVIPKSFYLIRPGPSGQMKLVSNTDGFYPKRCPVGVYDETIVTEKGERHFLRLDDYAYKLLVEKFSTAKPLTKDGTTYAYVYPTYDYAILKLFFLSVLWRAHASSQKFFAKVRLGPHASAVAGRILKGDPGGEESYSVVLAIFDDRVEYPKIMDPFPERYEDGVRFYRFYLGNIIAYIKVDRRKTPYPFQPVQLRPSHPLLLIQREFLGSKEHRVMRMLLEYK